MGQTDFTTGDVSGSQTLTDSDHLYPSHINELRAALNLLESLLDPDDETLTTSGKVETSSDIETTGGSLKGDTVSESTAGAGVTADGVKLKDSQVYTDTINEKVEGNGVTADGVKLKDSQVYTDTIVEKTDDTGITVDSLLIKDGRIGSWDGWMPVTDTWTYASATTITVPSGAASLYQKGDKIKYTQSTGGTKYATIILVADTLLTIADGDSYTLVNEAITSPYYSKSDNPQEFPIVMTWTPTITYAGGTTNPTSNTVIYAHFHILRGLVFFKLMSTVVKGGGNRTEIQYTLPVTRNNIGNQIFPCWTEVPTTNAFVSAYSNNTTQLKVPLAMNDDGSIFCEGSYEL